ncbi:hypothetical protein AMAG_14181 [Allomyces macrogynus ATCC 38327]|uniref:Uncharacterized protein n=1 Tax=Allomyces macrogynus (strain ATCC 38327) TaxID=578462 RepID=A0A0L0T4J1_ALLM3|nr:hypothetical protein AMAG_14181 [Allomyces macrogynus ATCC 38327]|eukprot:KNE69626.1 hypothetical protein AMAG_14181 [Allomyces macrogynus ATCC 38327]
MASARGRAFGRLCTTTATTPPHSTRKSTRSFGAHFPYLAAIGNHDLVRWTSHPVLGAGYRDLLAARLRRIPRVADVHCDAPTRDMGEHLVCTIRGVQVHLSGVGTYGAKHANHLANSLSASNHAWRVCGWHKNQRAYQPGSKPDETGYKVKYGYLPLADGTEFVFSARAGLPASGRVVAAHLQVMGATGANPAAASPLLVDLRLQRPTVPAGPTLQAVRHWYRAVMRDRSGDVVDADGARVVATREWTADEWEKHEVWVSPNLVPETGVDVAEFAGMMRVHVAGGEDDPRWVFTGRGDKCLAPSLMLHIDTCA